MEEETHRCNAYCTEGIHALLLTARAGTTLAAFEGWAACFGYVLHEVRRVLEVDLATEQAKRKFHWDPSTWQQTPYERGDALPTDEVWMVRVSVAAAGVSVAEPGEERGPRPGWAWCSVRWRRLLWWRRQ
jgi:hypothetical protein